LHACSRYLHPGRDSKPKLFIRPLEYLQIPCPLAARITFFQGGALIPIKEAEGKCRYRFFTMMETKKADQAAAVDQNPVSAVKLSADLTADIDAWAGVHAINRSEAIRRLIEAGLKSEAMAASRRVSRRDAVAVEELAASLINQFIDPDTPQEERDRRIHRLTEGPPEFVDLRIDLPKRGR
jgi:hypothetical protein